MANERRVRTNFVAGLIEDNPLTSGATTLTSIDLANLPVINTTNHTVLILDPDGLAGAPEIVYVTAHTSAATTATIVRGKESTSARAHNQDTPWCHGPVASDFLTSYAHVINGTGTQSCTNNAFTKLALDTVLIQSNELPFNTTNNTYTAPAPGRVLITGWCGVPLVAYGQLLLTVYVGGVEILRGPQQQTSLNQDTIGIFQQMACAAGDVFDVRIFQSSGADRIVTPQYMEFAYLGTQ